MVLKSLKTYRKGAGTVQRISMYYLFKILNCKYFFHICFITRVVMNKQCMNSESRLVVALLAGGRKRMEID